jgi:hypothetical protein
VKQKLHLHLWGPVIVATQEAETRSIVNALCPNPRIAKQKEKKKKQTEFFPGLPFPDVTVKVSLYKTLHNPSSLLTSCSTTFCVHAGLLLFLECFGHKALPLLTRKYI